MKPFNLEVAEKQGGDMMSDAKWFFILSAIYAAQVIPSWVASFMAIASVLLGLIALWVNR